MPPNCLNPDRRPHCLFIVSADQPPIHGASDDLLAHGVWLRRLARALTDDDSSADDLTQEVWLRTLGQPAPRSPRAWLATVLRNVVSNRRLSDSRRAAREAAVHEQRQVPSPETIAQRTEAAERVARAVGELDEPYRTVVYLRYLEGLTPPEIAARLGIPLETVRTRLRRGLALLRQRLDAVHDGDRKAWCVLLGALSGPESSISAVPHAASASAGVVTVGAIVMTATQKLVVAATLALLLAGGIWWAQADDEPAASEVVATVPESPEDTTASTKSADPESLPETGRQRVQSPAVASTPDPPTTVRTTLRARVIEDRTGVRIRGARVRLGRWRQDAYKDDAPAGISDEEGLVRITGLTEQRHTSSRFLVVEHADFATAEFSIKDRWPHGDTSTEIDLGNLALEEGALVSGRVISGSGTVVPGATILFCRETRASSPPRFHPAQSIEVATTDAEGRFTLEHVAPGVGAFRHTLFALSDGKFGWRSLPVVAGRKDLVDQDIPLAPTGRLSVAVRGPDGAHVPESRVVVHPRFAPVSGDPRAKSTHDLYIGREDLQDIFIARTTASGAAEFAHLPVNGESGRYDITVWAPGSGRAVQDGVIVSVGETTNLMIDVTGDQLLSVSGVVRDRDGRPIAGANVKCRGIEATADDQGLYRVAGIDRVSLSSNAWLVANADGFAQIEHRFKAPESGDLEDLDLVMDAAVRVPLRAVDTTGKPLERVQFTLRNDFELNVVVFTDADGRVDVQAGAGRSTKLTIYPPRPHADWIVPSERTIVPTGEEVVVELRRAPAGARVVVELRDASTETAIDPVKAMLLRGEGNDAPGRFHSGPTFAAGQVTYDRIPPGSWDVWVLAEGYSPLRVGVVLEKGATEVRVIARCPHLGVVRGVVRGLPDASRRRMAFLSLADVRSKPQWVKLQSDPKLIGATWVETDGSFRIEGVPAGRLRIRMREPGFAGSTDVFVPGGGEVAAELTLRALGRVTFRCAEAPPLRVVRVRYAAIGEPFGNWFGFVSRDGARPEVTVDVPPGRVRWQSHFAAPRSKIDPDAEIVGEGEFDSVAGEVLDVVIPVR